MTFKERMKGFVMSSFIGRQLVKLWVYREHNVDVHLESEQKGATKQYYDLDENEIEEIINNSDEVRLITPMPENIADNWEMQDDLTDEEEAIMIASMQNNKLEDDIPDQVLNDEHFSYEDAMEYNEAWYPDTGNDYPNTSSIKLWIQEVKWAGLDDIDLYYEYVERYDVKKPRADHRINFKEKENLDSVGKPTPGVRIKESKSLSITKSDLISFKIVITNIPYSSSGRTDSKSSIKSVSSKKESTLPPLFK